MFHLLWNKIIMADSKPCCLLSPAWFDRPGVDIWAIMPYRFARSVFLNKCVTKLLFHGAGVSGLGFMEVCTLVFTAETGKGQMCGLHHFSGNSQNIWNANGRGNWCLRTLGKGELNDTD